MKKNILEKTINKNNFIISKIITVLIAIFLVSTVASSVIGSSDFYGNDNVIIDNYSFSGSQETPSDEDYSVESLKDDSYKKNFETKSTINVKVKETIASFILKLLEKFPGLASSPFMLKLMEKLGIQHKNNDEGTEEGSEGSSDDTSGDSNEGSEGSGDIQEGGADDTSGTDTQESDGADTSGGESGDQGSEGSSSSDGGSESSEGDSGSDEGDEDSGSDDEDDEQDYGDVIVLPEYAHITLMGEGYMEVNTTVNVNDEFLVVLQGILFMSTDMKSIDIWWNLTTGYLEINASAFSYDGTPFFRLEDFLIEIKEYSNPDNKITFTIGLIEADASACLIINQTPGEGSVEFSGVINVEDIQIYASNFILENFTVSGSFNFSAGVAGDLSLKWNETSIKMDGGLDVSSTIEFTLNDFYIHVGAINITASIDYLSLSDGVITLHLGNNIYGRAGATVNMTGLYVKTDFAVIRLQQLDATGEISVNTDLEHYVLVGAAGYIYMQNFSMYVSSMSLSAKFSELEAEGALGVRAYDSGSIGLNANGTIEINYFDVRLGVTCIKWDKLAAEGQVSLYSSPSAISVAASGEIEIFDFYFSTTGILAEFDYLGAQGGVSVYLGSAISAYAGGYILISNLHVILSDINAYVAKISAVGEVSVYLGSYIDAQAKGTLNIVSAHVTGPFSLTMGSLTLSIAAHVHIGNYVEGAAKGALSITSFEFSAGGFSIGWSSFVLSGSARAYVSSAKVEVGGYDGGGAGASLTIKDAHLQGISELTGNFGVNGGGSANLQAGDGMITFTASAGGHANGVIFSGLGIDFTLGSLTLSVGGSGSINVADKEVDVTASGALSISSLDIDSPADIEIPSAGIQGSGRIYIKVVSSDTVQATLSGYISGHIIMGGMLVELSADGSVSGTAAFTDQFQLSLSVSGNFNFHFESGGTIANLNIAGSGSVSGSFSGGFSSGDVSINAGGLYLSLNLIVRGITFDITVSGSITVVYRASGSSARIMFSGGDGCSATISISSGGSTWLDFNLAGSGGGSVNVEYHGGGIPPSYCMISASIPSISVTFNAADKLKGSVGPGSAYLRWDKYADFGDRLTISGDLSGSLFFNDGGWVQIWPWPWLEGAVTLSAKGPEGSWDKNSISIMPGETASLKAELNIDDSIENEESSTGNYASFAGETGSGSYRYDFYYGDATTCDSKESDTSCYSSHTYTDLGIYTAQVLVYDSSNFLIGSDTVTIEVGNTLEVDLSVSKLLPYTGEAVTFTADVKTSDESESSDESGGIDSEYSFATADEYNYEFIFGDGQSQTVISGQSASVTYTYLEPGFKTASVRVTKVETGEFGGASCMLFVLSSLKVKLRPDKYFAQPGEAISFTAEVESESDSNVDSDSSNNDDVNPSYSSYDPTGNSYRYDFKFGQEDTYTTEGGTSASASHAFSDTGKKAVSVTVTDLETGIQGSAFTAVFIFSGLEVTLSADPKTPKVDESVTFSVSVKQKSNSNSNVADSTESSQTSSFASFASSDDYNYDFDFGDGMSSQTSGGSSISVSHSYSESGDKYVKVVVSDDQGNTGIAGTTVYVGGAGVLQTSPGSLNFGVLAPGETASRSFSVKNTGTDIPLDWSASSAGLKWASMSPLGGTGIPPGGSATVTVTVTAPTVNDNSVSQSSSSSTPVSSDSSQTINSAYSIMFDGVESTISFAEAESVATTVSNIGTTTTYVTKTFEGIIDVWNNKNIDDYDCVHITFTRRVAQESADAGMQITVQSSNQVHQAVVYEMVPKTYVTESGYVVDTNDYSVVANVDSTYNIQYQGETVQSNIVSTAEVVSYFENVGAQQEQSQDTGDDGDSDPTNHAPHLNSISDKSVTEGNTISFTVTASDSDGDSLSFSKNGVGSLSGSSSYSFAADTGTSQKAVTYTYTASEDSNCDDETKTVTITVSDGRGGTDSDTFKINVNDDDSCDDCCFPAGTKISMADGSVKNIEDVKVGEDVISFNEKLNELAVCRVISTVSPVRDGVYEINDGLLSPTDDHPVYVRKPDGIVGWAAINPAHAESGYKISPLKLEVGDELLTLDGEWIKIYSIKFKQGPIQTYNLEDVSGNSNFFANSILVHNAVDCSDSNEPSSSGSSTPSYSSFSAVSYLDEKIIPKDIRNCAEATIRFDGTGSLISTEDGVYSIDYDNLDAYQDDDLFYLWDFGDGNFGCGLRPTHTYRIEASDIYSFTDEESPEENIFSYSTSFVDIADEVINPITDDTQVIDDIIIETIQTTISYPVVLLIFDENGDIVSADITNVDVNLSFTTLLSDNTDTFEESTITQQATSISEKNIQDIQPSDLVASFSLVVEANVDSTIPSSKVLSNHHFKPELAYYMVIEYQPLSEVSSDSIVSVYSEGDMLKVTPCQKVYVNGRFIEAEDIQVGDVLSLFTGDSAEVTSIRTEQGYVDIYNLEVEGNYNYYANGVLVGDITTDAKYSVLGYSGFLAGTMVVVVDDASSDVDGSSDITVPIKDDSTILLRPALIFKAF